MLYFPKFSYKSIYKEALIYSHACLSIHLSNYKFDSVIQRREYQQIEEEMQTDYLNDFVAVNMIEPLSFIRRFALIIAFNTGMQYDVSALLGRLRCFMVAAHVW